MNCRYLCVCNGLPNRLLQHLAETAHDDKERDALRAQIKQGRALRGERAAEAVRGVQRPAGTKPLQHSVFDAQGRTFLPGKLLRDEGDPPARDPAANQAFDNIGVALRFFSDVFKRNSIDGKGLRVDASVHYGLRQVNAMWTGEQMVIGDGDGSVSNLAGSLGMIAHEFCHGVSQHMVPGGLGVVNVPGNPPALKGEAGALNESFSDVFASMVKQWHGNQKADVADWLVGEDILAAGRGKAVRSLKDPGNRDLTYPKDDQIKDFRRYRVTDDVHKASGIPNHAFYVAASALQGHTWKTLGPVWYQAFDTLHARASFLDAAHACLAVAARQHGKGSDTHKAVKDGWKKVNVLT